MTTARELLAGLHELSAGRRLRVALDPAEAAALLPTVAHARLPMHSGPVWRRFVYPGLDAGPWALGASDHPVWLIDIGAAIGRVEAGAAVRTEASREIAWYSAPRITEGSRGTTTRVHATANGSTTLCNCQIAKGWKETRLMTRIGTCNVCYARAYGEKVPPQWPVDRTAHEEAGRAFSQALEAIIDEPLWIPCVDEIELPNEVRGDPRLWLDKAPDGYPYRLNGSTHRQLREMHRSTEAWERGVELTIRARDRADLQTADRAWANRHRRGKRSHVDDPRRLPATLPQ